MVTADDIGLQNNFPRSLDRIAAKVNDAIDAFAGFFDAYQVCQICLDKGLVRLKVLRFFNVTQDNFWISRRQ